MSGIVSDNKGRASGVIKTGVADFDDNKIQANIALLGFKTAVNGSLAKYNLVDQIVDEYTDATGVDTSASTNEVLTAGVYGSSIVITPTQDADATGVDGDYSWYKWTDTGATGSYVLAADHDVDFLVIAGGGGGGGTGVNGGGGGGAGGYRNSFASELSGGAGANQSALSFVDATTYTITVGAGGAAGATGSDGGVSSITGSDITDVVTVGGGGGASAGAVGRVGGSGSGSGRDQGTTSGAAGTANEGYAGGAAGGNTAASAGGGGGAGAVGYAGKNPDGAGDPFTTGQTEAQGGVGKESSIDGTATFRGGGGGGSYEASDGVGHQPLGGNGGGGKGATSTTANASTAGTANTGGGGGAGKTTIAASAGGSGVVIIRKLTSAGASVADLTLQSLDTTASTANPDSADMIVLMEDDEGTATLNTDIKGYISEDSGVTFTQGTLVNEGSWGTNKKIVAFHDLDISAQTGSAMCYKITTHNQSAGSKETKIHATSIGWK